MGGAPAVQMLNTLNAEPLLWNRAFVLGLAVVFVALAVRWFGRQEFDAQRILFRL